MGGKTILPRVLKKNIVLKKKAAHLGLQHKRLKLQVIQQCKWFPMWRYQWGSKGIGQVICLSLAFSLTCLNLEILLSDMYSFKESFMLFLQVSRKHSIFTFYKPGSESSKMSISLILPSKVYSLVEEKNCKQVEDK